MKRVMDVGLAIVLGAVVSTVAGDEGAAQLVDAIAEGLLDADVGESGSGEASASELNCTAFNVTEPRICKIGGQDSGVFFPLFNGENEWSEVSQSYSRDLCSSVSLPLPHLFLHPFLSAHFCLFIILCAKRCTTRRLTALTRLRSRPESRLRSSATFNCGFEALVLPMYYYNFF